MCQRPYGSVGLKQIIISCKVNVISLGEVYVFVCKGNEIEKLGVDACVCVVDEIIQL